MFVRMLSVRERFESNDDLGGVSSSWFPAWTEGALLSLLPCRRGGGAAGLRACVLPLDAERFRVTTGGVGGRGLDCRSAKGSGTLPMASRSKGESTASSTEGRKGVCGRGLFTSVGREGDIALLLGAFPVAFWRSRAADKRRQTTPRAPPRRLFFPSDVVSWQCSHWHVWLSCAPGAPPRRLCSPLASGHCLLSRPGKLSRRRLPSGISKSARP